MIWKNLSSCILICCGLIAAQCSHALSAEARLSIRSLSSPAHLELVETDLLNNSRSKSERAHSISHRCTRTRKHIRICANKRRIRFGLARQDIARIDRNAGSASIQAALKDSVLTDGSNAIVRRHIILYRSMRIRI